MPIAFTITNETKEKIPSKRDFLATLQGFLRYVKLEDAIVEVNIITVTNESIRTLNKKHRGKDAATDVLSFPVDIATPKDMESYRSGDTIVLGDIYVSPMYIRKNTVPRNTHKEILKLFLHGLIHLVGYDHKTNKQQVLWEEIENKIKKEVRVHRASLL